MIIFDGMTFAQTKEELLATRVAQLAPTAKQPHIAAILFTEDAGSRLYTRLKQEAATRVGIGYTVYSFSMTDDIQQVIAQIQQLNQDPQVTGIIIQKPWRARWAEVTTDQSQSKENITEAFNRWWQQLVSSLIEEKDVDGLHPSTLEAIKANDWQEKGKVLPATAKAVIDILKVADQRLRLSGDSGIEANASFTILGKSDILGQPLFYQLSHQYQDVEMIGSTELKQKIEQGKFLRDRQVVISATGRKKLITGSQLRPGVIVIDVGEPEPDVDQFSVASVASFLTPVPGGVGPVTVVSLLENAVKMLGG